MTIGKNVLNTLRHMIIVGEIKSGTHLAEIPTANLLGVSRQPVRIALKLLEQEGLLSKNIGRGYSVRDISPKIIEEALEVRGVLEGLAVRKFTEQGINGEQQNLLQTCLDKIETIFHHSPLTQKEIDIYHHYNSIFHQTILKSIDNQPIALALSQNNHLPMASLQATFFNQKNYASEVARLHLGHAQHYAIYQAIVQQEGIKAEALMREHSQIVLFNHRLDWMFM